MVKGISGWGRGKTADAQSAAARNAAVLVFDLIEARAFARPDVL